MSYLNGLQDVCTDRIWFFSLSFFKHFWQKSIILTKGVPQLYHILARRDTSKYFDCDSPLYFLGLVCLTEVYCRTGDLNYLIVLLSVL